MPKNIQAGNSFYLLLFQTFNFLVFLSAMGILGCSIYLFVQLDTGNIMNYILLAISGSLLLLTICAFRLKKSVHLLCCYLMI